MKKHLLKLAILVLLLTLPTIKNTNSYYSDEKKIVANSVSTGYWVPPAVPTLTSPENGTITSPTKTPTPIFMSWNGVSGALYYIYQDSRNGESVHLFATSMMLFIVPDGTFWWRVKACNSADVCSGWSDSWTLTMDGTQPLSVSLSVTGSWSKTVDEKITNGSFEDGSLSGWTSAGAVAVEPAGSWAIPTGNTYMARIGNTTDPGKMVWENRLMQSVNSGAKTLSFDYNFFTTDSGLRDDPGFFARLNGQQIFATGAASINPSNPLFGAFSSGWKTFSYDLSNYSDGQKLNLTIYAGNTGGTNDQSWVYIDKVTTTFVAAPSHATFHLTGSDNPGGSGIKRFEYNVDNSGWKPGASFTIIVSPIEGPHILQYRSVDNADNYGSVSQTNIIVDDTAPSAISDLKAKANFSPNSITLTWTAPGNDGTLGKASSYDVRYSTSEITGANFSSATQSANVPAPKESGQSESLEVLGLDQNQIYYFAIKTSDEAPNVSGLSNPAFDTTAETSYDFNSGDIVINELMWMGTGAGTADEYLELRNMTTRTISLSGFKLMKLNGTTLVMDDIGISFVGKTIAPNGYFLITNYHPGSGSSDLKSSVIADIESSSLSLSNSALEIELVDPTGYTIDKTGDGGLPFAGENTGGNKFSMERTSVPGDGGNALNWYTCIDALSTTDFFTGIFDRGTPGAVNRSENEPIPVKNIIATPSATITNDGKSVSFKIINLGGFEKLSYVLTYDSDQAPQGIQGMAKLQGVDFFEKTGILLGTCSTGGTCVYHTGVKNIKLKVYLTDSLGKITMLEGGEE